MLVSSYQSTTQEKVFVIVPADKTPESLGIPAIDDLGPFAYFQDLELDPGEPRYGIDVVEVIQSVSEKGYFIRRIVGKTQP